MTNPKDLVCDKSTPGKLRVYMATMPSMYLSEVEVELKVMALSEASTMICLA